MQEKLKGMEMPDLAAMTTMNINMDGNSGFTMPSDLVDLMKNSDVTTITQNAKTLASRMFDLMTPDVIAKIQDGIGKGIDGIGQGAVELTQAIPQMQKGYDGIGQGIEGMNAGIAGQNEGLKQLNTVSNMLETMGNPEIPEGQSLADLIPSFVKSMLPEEALKELAEIHSTQELNAKIQELNDGIATLTTKVAEAQKSRADMKTAMDGMNTAILQMQDLQTKMEVLKEAIPGAFTQAKENYLAAIDAKAPELEGAFQNTLNSGFGKVYLTSAIASLLALLMLAFYANKAAIKAEESGIIEQAH